MKVWLDDRQPPYPDPQTWVWVKTPSEAIELLQTGMITELSLDHDLALTDGEREITGYDVVTWIERAVAIDGFIAPAEMRVYSANASAAPRMEQGIASIRRLVERSHGEGT